MPLDLASLDSVDSFAKRYAASSTQLDILVNNAGVMAIPERQATKDGFEMQFGTNHLGESLRQAPLTPQAAEVAGAEAASAAVQSVHNGFLREGSISRTVCLQG